MAMPHLPVQYSVVIVSTAATGPYRTVPSLDFSLSFTHSLSSTQLKPALCPNGLAAH